MIVEASGVSEPSQIARIFADHESLNEAESVPFFVRV